MPSFDLRHVYCAKYVNTDGTVSYTNAQQVGDAMAANIELRYAEGRLYAESTLAEYMRKAVGGTISIGVKYIKNAAQQLMFGMRPKQRSISYTPEGAQEPQTITAEGLVIGSKDEGAYVGIAFYAPDMVDGAKKYTCVFVKKCLFGPPGMSLQTAGQNIQFVTPTTTGELLADDTGEQELFEVALMDDEQAAIAWVTAVLQ